MRLHRVFTSFIILFCVGAAQPLVAQTAAPEGMVLIPAGEYWRGRVHFFIVEAYGLFERDRMDDFPAHRIDVDAFYIDKYEVTNAEYARFLEAKGGKKPWHWPKGEIAKGEERLPVTNVNWSEADAYCKWAGKRLPTEAEWEKASRGGLDRKRFAWGDVEPGLAGYDDAAGRGATRGRPPANVNSLRGAVAVGSFPPNGYGLYDMVGNVWEFCSDWYDKTYYPVSPNRNPQGPDTGMYKIVRGGSWADDDERVFMNHFRNFTDPTLRASTIGFRCAAAR